MDVDFRGRFHDGWAEWVFLEMPSIEVDFNNCDREGRVRLNTIGAIRSLNESRVTLRNGLEVELTSGDTFPLKGIVEYSETEQIWVARFNLNDLRDKVIDTPSES
jgi:hypothetical protein